MLASTQGCRSRARVAARGQQAASTGADWTVESDNQRIASSRGRGVAWIPGVMILKPT